MHGMGQKVHHRIVVALPALVIEHAHTLPYAVHTQSHAFQSHPISLGRAKQASQQQCCRECSICRPTCACALPCTRVCMLKQCRHEWVPAHIGVNNCFSSPLHMEDVFVCVLHCLPLLTSAGVLLHAVSRTGCAEPLGPSRQGDTTNFAVYSGGASAVQLVLMNPEDNSRQELPMNKSGACVWCIWALIISCRICKADKALRGHRQQLPLNSISA